MQTQITAGAVNSAMVLGRGVCIPPSTRRAQAWAVALACARVGTGQLHRLPAAVFGAAIGRRVASACIVSEACGLRYRKVCNLFAGCTTNAASGSPSRFKHGGGNQKLCSVAGCTTNPVRKRALRETRRRSRRIPVWRLQQHDGVKYVEDLHNARR